MENQIYLIYNRLANRYVAVMSFETDELMKARLSDPKAQFNYDELEVCKVGTYNISTGVVISAPPTRVEIPHAPTTVDEVATEVK